MAKEETYQEPSREEWEALYQAAIRVKELAPWQWMEEMDIFGVQDPGTGRLGFVSVMGTLGEHFSIAAYLGAFGLYSFWDFVENADIAPPETLLLVPHLQASFEDRGELTDQDRKVIKQLGLKFRGRKEWPLFRSYRPGFFPWHVEAPEARFLTRVLEQVLDVAPRFKENPDLLSGEDVDQYLVRVGREEGEEIVWEDRMMCIEPPEPKSIPLKINTELLEELEGTSRRLADLELDFFMLPALIGERGTRPSCAYSLMMVDGESGIVLGQELLQCEPSLEEMQGRIPHVIMQRFARLDVLPEQVWVRSDLLYAIMELLAQSLGFEVHYTQDLPALDEARDFLMRMMG